MARLWRVHHPGLPTRAGASFELSAEESRHVRRVLRLKPGERIAVFDGEGNEWRAVIDRMESRGVSVKLESALGAAVEPAVEIDLFQGLCRAERMEWLVQKATEVGVSSLQAIATERSGRHGVTDHRLARWRRIAVEACKQCGRSRVPRIDVGAALPASPPPGTLGLLLDAEPGAPSLADVCAAVPVPPPGVWIAVGPEGGFEPREIEAWARQGWRRTGLGPRTLRADTAGVVAAAIVLHRWGDLGSAFPPGPDC
jgi:16S rRNA (uracil1498-N3)-methyltransferase